MGIIDIDLGALGDARAPVREAFALRGVPLSNALITRLRTGATKPTHTAYRLGCVARLRANDASLKTDYCLRVLSVGLEHRQRSHERPRVYACHGLTRAMEAALGCSHSELSYVMRAMRADLALWSTHTWDDELVVAFREAATLFLRVHHHRNGKVFRHTNDIVRVAWDKHTIHGFYFALYHTARSLTRASWFPYELDLLWSFYVRQRELGSPLTPLDRQVLAGAVSSSPTSSRLSQMVRAYVGVDYDVNCVTTHRHMLVTGASRIRPGVAPVQVEPPTKKQRAPRRFRGAQRTALSYFQEYHPWFGNPGGRTSPQ